MRLLITGGNSTVVQTIAKALASDHTVRLFDTEFTTNPSNQIGVSLARITGDIRNGDDCARAVAGVDVLLHFATLTEVRTAEVPAQAVLDIASRGAFVLMNAARAAGVGRVILASTLALFDQLPAHWQVNEEWRPRPRPSLAELAPWITELSVRESARVGTMQVICLRFGEIVDDQTIATAPYDPRWLHIHDAIAGIHCALRYESSRQPDWRIFHIGAPGSHAKIRHQCSTASQEPFSYQPQHDFSQLTTDYQPPPRDDRPWQDVLASVAPVASRPIRNVLILGAGGPMGVVTTQELLSSYTLRVTDIHPLAQIAAANKPQAPGAPLPVPVDAPHQELLVDVRNAVQVLDAAAQMDAILNCTVVRHQLDDAFLVNTVGAYHIMQAAVAHNIRRVVQTGPLVQHLEGFGDYSWDYDLPVDAPGRGFDHQYIHSKFLGQEICRVFAEYYGLEVPVLLFCALYNPDVIESGYSLFTISWADTGRALRRALEVTSLPSPYEQVNISADLPHGRFDHRKAQWLLNWQPHDGLEQFWQDNT